MDRILGRFAPHTFAILRIVAGLMFALHGTQKLFGWPGDRPPVGAMLFVLAGVIEAGGGALMAIGFLTRWAAFISSGTMAVAYFYGHAGDGFFPTQNGGELAVVYCFLFLYVAARGAGIWSVDDMVAKEEAAQAEQA